MPLVGVCRRSGWYNRPPGMKKSMGETLFVALMPPHPAPGKSAASTSNKSQICFEFNFTGLYTIVLLLMLATPNSPGAIPRPAPTIQWVVAARNTLTSRCWSGVCVALCLACLHGFGQTDPRAPANAEFAEKAQKAYADAKARFKAETNNPEAMWLFARACFDQADYATTSAKRAEIAEEGIVASRLLLKIATNSVPGHYYLGMNLGQQARTKSLGALKIVTQMENEFNFVLTLDPAFDFAGPDRNLAMLYLDAPDWPVSVGSKTKARQHLQAALKLCPDYPGNRLNLIEAELKWGERQDATAGLAALDELWPVARKKLAGDDWAASWAEWEERREAFQKKVRSSSKTR